MNLFICSISFRHQLISIEELVTWAARNHFQGIELWGIHAKNLADQPNYNKDWLAQFGLRTTMVSDYLPLFSSEQALFYATQQLCRLCKHWGAPKLRTFAGNKASADTSDKERKDLENKLRSICDWLAEYELNLVIESHPNTLADSVESIEELMCQVKRPNLKLNFDVLHIWESKANEIEALQKLAPHIDHFHLKNISAFDKLEVFSPTNVYAAAGKREGMVPLFEGAVDYKAFFECIYSQANGPFVEKDASLEWFGHQSKSTLARDRYLIQQLQQQFKGPAEQVN